jgi:acyl-CoA thioester hydrolase
MNIQEIETFRGLVKSSDINALRLLKRSSCVKFFEDATYFTKAIFKNLIIESENYLESEYFDSSILQNMSVYVRTDLNLQSQDKIRATHSLFLLNKDNNKEDQILSKQSLILNCKNIDKSLKINLSNSKGIYSAFKDLVRKEDCDQMSHMNVQYYFGKHADAIKCLFNKINSYSTDSIDYKILNERCIFSREVHLNSVLEIVFKVKSIENNELLLLSKVYSIDHENVSAYFETSISLNINEKTKNIILNLFSIDTFTFLNELEFSNLRPLTDNRPPQNYSRDAFISCKSAVNTWDLDHETVGSSQFKIGCVSDAATHLFTYCGADFNWRNEYDIGSAALDYSVRYFKDAPLGMAVTMHTNFTKIGNKSLKFIHHMVDDSTGDVIMDIEIVAVLFDLKKRKSLAVPENFRVRASKLLIDC